MDAAALRIELRKPAYVGLTDAQAAALAGTPVLTPKSARVTVASVSDSTVWGLAKAAAFVAALEAVKASGGANGAVAGTLLSLISGPGFNPADSQVPGLIPTIVALAGGTITTDDAELAVYDAAYPVGGPVTDQDVTDARAANARQDLNNLVGGALAAVANEYLPTHLDPVTDAPTRAAVLADLDARLVAAGVP